MYPGSGFSLRIFHFYGTVDDALLYIFPELILFPKDDIVTVMKISLEWHFCSDSGFCDMACSPYSSFQGVTLLNRFRFPTYANVPQVQVSNVWHCSSDSGISQIPKLPRFGFLVCVFVPYIYSDFWLMLMFRRFRFSGRYDIVLQIQVLRYDIVLRIHVSYLIQCSKDSAFSGITSRFRFPTDANVLQIRVSQVTWNCSAGSGFSLVSMSLRFRFLSYDIVPQIQVLTDAYVPQIMISLWHYSWDSGSNWWICSPDYDFSMALTLRFRF